MKLIKAVASAVGLLVMSYAVPFVFVWMYTFAVRLLMMCGLSKGISELEWHIVSLCTELLIIPALWLFYRLQKKSPFKEMYYTRCAVRPLILGAAIGLVGCLAVSLLMLYMPFPQTWQEDYTQKSQELLSDWSPFFKTIMTVIVAPLTEELIYRGLLYGRLRRGMPWWIAAVISAAVFGYAHGSAIWTVYTFLLGLVFAYLFERTNSLWPSIIAHMVFNIVGQISIFPDWTPLLVVVIVYTMSPYVLGLLLWRYTIVTRKPPADAPHEPYLFEQVM